MPDAEAPAEDVLPDENIGDTTEITDDMSEEEEFEEEESELGTYEGGKDFNNATYADLNRWYSASFSSQGSHWYKFYILRKVKLLQP